VPRSTVYPGRKIHSAVAWSKHDLIEENTWLRFL